MIDLLGFLGGMLIGGIGFLALGRCPLVRRALLDRLFRRRIAWARPRDTRNRVVGPRPVAWPGLRAARLCQICYGSCSKPCPKCEKRGHCWDRPKRGQPAKCPDCRIATGCICARAKPAIQARRIGRLTGFDCRDPAFTALIAASPPIERPAQGGVACPSDSAFRYTTTGVALRRNPYTGTAAEQRAARERA